MIGFMPEGAEIELGGRQEQAVREILAWEQGCPLQDDPYRRKFPGGVREG